MYLRRSTTVKYVIAAFIGAVIYCEWFVYIIQQQYWTELECNDHDATCKKILFIADPQIQGDEAVPPPLSYLFNWDSDRYLRSTFKVVVEYLKPDILVYLGDLMDEGSIATMPQFHGYVKRLASIFEWDYPAVQVWIPGDNDIGGENEPIRYDKIEEFEKVFKQPSIVVYSNISFYKVNAITYTFPQKADEIPGSEMNFKIAVSHYPVTEKSMFAYQIMKAINPNIFFCAHDHESKYVKQNKNLGHRKTVWLNGPNPTLNISFDEESLYEVFVPTCSYRMGTSSIGYGAAVLENNQQNMRYTVFWSPTRFPCLILYLSMLVILLLYCLVFCVARLCHRKSTLGAKSGDMSPLLQRI
ncbi:unnamed protein product [Spodoptera littoralis]|uniref:Calcineurin-like phosphoesterase domain-containing protein n=1 Tax=Spodoptera littoralis TaxID=7109 RepID=A0A9P0ID56_SPOLI|nr:unnamed protein product [Spodoptera littoralis]CAH1644652.1 unnamed protein product [Spodoptera littoralis]